MKCPVQVAVAHGMTHQVPHHEAQAGMTLQVALAHAVAGRIVLVHLLAQAGTVAQALAQATVQVHQVGINYVFC